MPKPEFERAAQLECDIAELVAEIFAAQRRSENIVPLQQRLDRLSRTLVIIRSASAPSMLEKVA
jgi:hypothetical protein